MGADIFISYCHADAALVAPIVKIISIRREDLVFQDTLNLTAGQKWEPQLLGALDNAKIVIVFWCKHSAHSDYVKKEYQTAISKGKEVWPLLLDDSELDTELAAYQWLDLREVIKHSKNTFSRNSFILVVSSLLIILLSFFFINTKDTSGSLHEDEIAFQNPNASSSHQSSITQDTLGSMMAIAADTSTIAAGYDNFPHYGKIPIPKVPDTNIRTEGYHDSPHYDTTPIMDTSSIGKTQSDTGRYFNESKGTVKGFGHTNEEVQIETNTAYTQQDWQSIGIILLTIIAFLAFLLLLKKRIKLKREKPSIESAASVIIDKLNEKLPKP